MSTRARPPRKPSGQVILSNASVSNNDNSGSIGATRVQDVFLKVEQSGQDARAWFETEYGMGEVLFHHGQMVRARLGGARGQTALLRLLSVTDGRYGVESCSVAPGPQLIGGVKALLELHNSRKSEWNDLCAHAPPLSSVLRLTASGAEVRDTARGIQRVMLVLIDGRRTLMQVLEESSFDPVEALRVVTKAVDDSLVQFAQQPSTLFPLASAGDASGVLPRMMAPAPVPHLQPAGQSLSSGPPSWRHATLVGLGTSSAKPEAKSGLAPAPIIDVGRGGQGSPEPSVSRFESTSDALQNASTSVEQRSLVKTVIHGFGAGRNASSARALAEISARGSMQDASDKGTRSQGLSDNRSDSSLPPSPIVDVSTVVASNREQAPHDAGPLSAAFPAGSVVAKPDGQRRYVDRYEILLRIGRGGMGTVYLARLSSSNVGFRRLFALKLLRSHLSSDTQAAKDFLDEARVAGYLHHANVVAVYDAGFHGKQPYLVMDYVEGCNFKQLMRGLPSRSPYLLLPVMIDALAGLHAAHTLQDETGTDLKLVHCDVSPENLLVGVDGTCRLTDFGIARKASYLFGATTRGKPGYVAPEQITGRTFDHRADIFSMGVVLWSALTGKVLFTGDTVEEILDQLCHKPIPAPSSVGAQSYEALDQVILKALARDPNDRFESAEAMMSALSRAAMAHDGLATTKEIASWVREAAGAELAQRRLAILDASRSDDSLPPDGDRGHSEETSKGRSPERASRGVPPESINSSVPPRPAADASNDHHSQPAFDPEIVSRPMSSAPPSASPQSLIDVQALFYGKDEVLNAARSAPPLGVGFDSNPPVSAAPIRKRIRLWIVAVVAVSLVVALLVTVLASRSKRTTHEAPSASGSSLASH